MAGSPDIFLKRIFAGNDLIQLGLGMRKGALGAKSCSYLVVANGI